MVARPPSDGRPNPLCAARWEVDQDFINRVICGHGARLSVGEIETIRSLSNVGRLPSEIAAATGRDLRRVREVISGATYGRVKP
jgi:hypothetical protein